MSALTIKIEVTGAAETQARMKTVRKVLKDRGPLHAAIGKEVMRGTAEFLKTTAKHGTAQRLGATPTGFRDRNAAALSFQSDANQAVLLIPRRTGLGRAFGEVVLVPGSGRTYLTIPAHRETYGKVVRDNFPPETFQFAMIRGHLTFPALVFKADGGGHKKGEVGYWLKTKITQKQDRDLLPSDEAWREGARDAANKYMADAIYHAQ